MSIRLSFAHTITAGGVQKAARNGGENIIVNAFKKLLQFCGMGVFLVLNVFRIEKKGMDMNIAACYFSYLAISIGITIWVARTLHSNGRVFLLDAFNGNAELADSVNHLLVVGFYLINVGYIALALSTTSPMFWFS